MGQRIIFLVPCVHRNHEALVKATGQVRRMLLCRYSALNTPASKHDYGRDCWVYNHILLYMKTYHHRQYVATLLRMLARAHTYACMNTHGLHMQAHYKRMHTESTFGYVAVIEAYCVNVARCDSTFKFVL